MRSIHHRPAAESSGVAFNPPAQAAAAPHPRRRRRFWMLAGVAGAMATLAACAQPGAGSAGGSGPGAGFGGGWGHHRGMRGPMSPEDMARRIDKSVEWVLSDVGASTEQKQKVAGLAKQALADLVPLREKHQAARKQAIDLLSAPAIDRVALERVRAEELQTGETASKRLTQALADVAEVLTPEQRAKLRERIERRMGRRTG